MRIARDMLTAAVLLVLLSPAGLRAQAQPDVWKEFASRIDVGTEVNVRLRNGQRFRATLVEAREYVVMLQPKASPPVPVQPVAYEAIVSLEQTKGGIGAGKAVAIGVATGVGAFFGTLLVMLAAVSD
jgi:hypothetical protein